MKKLFISPACAGLVREIAELQQRGPVPKADGYQEDHEYDKWRYVITKLRGIK